MSSRKSETVVLVLRSIVCTPEPTKIRAFSLLKRSDQDDTVSMLSQGNMVEAYLRLADEQ